MEKLKSYFGFKLALLFFLIGTLFLLTYLIFKDEIIILLGYFYVLAAVFANIVIELVLFIRLFSTKTDNAKTFLNMIILAVNIPIATLYFFIVINTL